MKKTIYTFLFIFLGLLSAKAQTILDEGFENTTDPFFVNVDTPELSSADSHSGSNCLYFAPAKGTWSQASDLFESNKWYHFPFWIKSSNPGELKLDHMTSDAFAVMGTDTIRATDTQDNGQSQIKIRDFVSFDAGNFILVTCDVYSGTASLYDGFGAAGNLVIGWWGEGSYFDDWKIEEFDPVEPTGIKTEFVNCSVYPNPATDRIYIKGENMRIVEILSIDGRILQSVTSTTQNEGIDIHHLNPGIYAARITFGNNKTLVNRFMKQ